MMKTLIKSVVPAPAWLGLSELRASAERTIQTLGLSAAATVALSPYFTARRLTPLRRLHLRGYRYPLYYRENTSDPDVIRQVFVHREYECIAQEPNVSLIIDCGANIGCTSFFLLHRYPKARLIAVEPDQGNFAVCRRNLLPFGDRVTLIRGGIWSAAVPLRVERGGYRDGREWAFQVGPVPRTGSPDFVATTIDEILKGENARRVDLLKIDIEGAELEVFRDGCERWLGRTRTLAIELHGAECERVFFHAMSQFQWSQQRSGESTVCRDIRFK